MASRFGSKPHRKRRLVSYSMRPLDSSAIASHRFGINKLALFNNDRELLSAGRDGIIRRWAVPDAAAAQTNPVVEQSSKFGEQNAELDNEPQQPSGGREPAKEPPPPPPPPPRCTAAYVSHTDWVTDLVVAEDRMLVSCSSDGTIKLWDLHSDHDEAGGGGSAGGADYVDLAGSSSSGDTVVEHDPLATVERHVDYVKCVAYAQQAGVLVSGGLDCAVLMWDLRRMAEPLTVMPHAKAAKDIVPSAEGKATVYPAGGKAKAGAGAGAAAAAAGAAADAVSSSWPPRLRLRAAMLAVTPSEVVALYNGKRSAYCVDVDPAGALVAAGGADRMLRLFDARQAAKICKLDGHTDAVRCVRLDSAMGRVISGSSDGTLRTWDLRQQRCVDTFAPDSQGTPIWCLAPAAAAPDSSGGDAGLAGLVYSGGRGGRICLTDTRGGIGVGGGSTGASCGVLVAEVGQPVLSLAAATQASAGGMAALFVSTTSPDLLVYCVPKFSAVGASYRRVAARTATAGPFASAAAASDAAGTADGSAADATSATATAEPSLVAAAAPATAAAALAAAANGGVDGASSSLQVLPLLAEPCCLARGLPGVMRHKVLNDRRHLLTEDNGTPPRVTLWDVVAAAEVGLFPEGATLEGLLAALSQLVYVRQWFSVDAKLGIPRIVLAESTAFDGEQFADEADAPPPLLPPPASMSAATAAAAVGGGGSAVRQESGTAGTVSGVGHNRQNGYASAAAAASFGRGTVATPSPSSAHDEIKVNLGERVLHGLLRVWQARREELLGSSRRRPRRQPRRRGSGSAAADSESSGYDDEDETSEEEGEEEEERTKGAAHEKAAVASGPLGRSAISEETVLWVTEQDDGSEGLPQERVVLRQRVGDFTGRETEDFLPGWVVDCVCHSDVRASSSADKIKFYLVPEPPASASADGSGGSLKARDVAAAAAAAAAAATAAEAAAQQLSGPSLMRMRKVLAYILGNDSLRAQLMQPRRGSGLGGGGGGDSTGAAAAPAGSGSSSRRRDWRRRKLSNDSSPSTAEAGSSGDDREDAAAAAGGDSGRSGGQIPSQNQGENPEDVVELLCNDVVLDPRLSLGAVCYCIWKRQAVMQLRFRLKRRNSVVASPATAAAAGVRASAAPAVAATPQRRQTNGALA